MLQCRLPDGVKKVFHPIICCALSAELAASAFGFLTGSGLDPVLGENNSSNKIFIFVQFFYICTHSRYHFTWKVVEL